MGSVFSDLRESSPLTVVLLLSLGGALSYVVISMIWRAALLVGQTAAKLRPEPSAPSRKAKEPFRVDTKPAKGAAPKAAPGKSVKQLLKESKAAAAAAHAETLPESKYFVNSLKGHGDVVVSVDVSSDDSHILTACADQVLRIYGMRGDFADAKPTLTRQPLKSSPFGAIFWGNAHTTAAITASLTLGADLVVTESPTSRGGSARDNQKVVSSALHGDGEGCIVGGAPTCGGRRPVIASMTKKKDVQLVMGDGRVLGRIEPNGIENYQVVMSPDGRFVAAATWGSDVKIWELPFARDLAFKGCQKAMELKGHRSGVLSVAFNPDATRVATSSRDKTLRIWNIAVRYQQSEDPKCLLTFQRREEPFTYTHLVWCPNGVLVGAFDHSLHYISAETGKVLARIDDAHGKRITCLRATAGKVKCGALGMACAVVTCSIDCKARVWAVPDGLADS